ncbi:MAG: alpha/beta hydrolase [Chloroflexi bacterium]|nr:alpha/beta hydrolase [Chloroflexota bacterium]
MVKNRSKFTKWVFIWLIASLVLSTGWQSLASAADLKRYPPPGQMVDVGGHHLHIHCMGTGELTVILEAGMSGWSTDWVLVQPEIAKITRVCAYDRAGYGWSEAGLGPRDSRQVATELHVLLSESGIDGDIILVGHSLGGLFAQYYAWTYPQQIAGIVLVDSVHPEQSLRMKEDVRKKYEGNLKTLTLMTSVLAPTGLLRLAGQSETIIAGKLPDEYQDMVRSLGFQSKAYQALNEEMASFEQSQAEVQDSEALLDIPLAVISSSSLQDFPPGFSGDYMKNLWDELQTDLNKSATLPQVVAVNGGHYIHIDQPELVIQAVTKMVNALQGK